MKKIIFIFFIISNLYGKYTAKFLQIPAGVRAGSMGNSYTSLAEDFTATYWNPGLISNIDFKEIGFIHYFWFGDINYNYISFITPTRFGNTGITLSFINSGEIEITKEDSSNTEKMAEGDFGIFTYTTFLFGISYARQIKGIPAGLTLKYFTEKLYTESLYGISLDIGTWFLIYRKPEIKLGIAIRNLGLTKIRGNYYLPPLCLNAGVSGRVIKNTIFSIEVEQPYEDSASFNCGFEYILKVKEKIGLFFRTGYTTISRVGKYTASSTETLTVDSFNGFTFGIGVEYRIDSRKKAGIDYALVPSVDLGSSHRISGRYRF